MSHQIGTLADLCSPPLTPPPVALALALTWRSSPLNHEILPLGGIKFEHQLGLSGKVEIFRSWTRMDEW